MTIRKNTRSQVVKLTKLLSTLPPKKVIYLSVKVEGLASMDAPHANWKAWKSGIGRAYVMPSSLGLPEKGKGDPGRVIVEISKENLHMISFGSKARWNQVATALNNGHAAAALGDDVDNVIKSLTHLKKMGVLTEAVKKELSGPLTKFLKEAGFNPLDLLLK